jgi:hypothetical protein
MPRPCRVAGAAFERGRIVSAPDSPEWVAAKASGDTAELAVAEWFRTRGFEPYRSLGRADFDLLLQSTVEVKHDRRAVESGQVAIETAHRNQPSGIVTSPATYWALVVGGAAFIVKTDELRRAALSGNYVETPGGDGRRSTLRLMPLADLQQVTGCKRVALGGASG